MHPVILQEPAAGRIGLPASSRADLCFPYQRPLDIGFTPLGLLRSAEVWHPRVKRLMCTSLRFTSVLNSETIGYDYLILSSWGQAFKRSKSWRPLWNTITNIHQSSNFWLLLLPLVEMRSSWNHTAQRLPQRWRSRVMLCHVYLFTAQICNRQHARKLED